MKCSIIIPVYNNAKFTKAALEDLVRLGNDHEIIIVDNASTDETYDVIQDINNRTIEEQDGNAFIRYIQNKENLGFATANNQGYEIAAGDFILFLNNDIKIKERHDCWTDQLINQCNGETIVGAQSGMLDQNYNPMREGQYDPMMKGAYLSGWCMMASKKTWDKLILEGQKGPWNDRFFLYYEDDDLSWRAKEAGMKLLIDNNLPLHHISRVTGKKYNMFVFIKKSKKIFKEIWKGKLL